MSTGSPTVFGRYFGRLVLQPLPDGRLMRVLEQFGFEDATRKDWPVPIGVDVDGASIPRALWSIMGGPFEGTYRDASVIHDYYCDVRTESWQAVHRVFYAAMRASGVSELRAKVMYSAVYFAGPRWSVTTTRNVRIGLSSDRFPVSEFEEGVFQATESQGVSALDYALNNVGDHLRRSLPERDGHALLHLDQLESIILARSPDLSEIDRALDKAATALQSTFDTDGENVRRTLAAPPRT